MQSIHVPIAVVQPEGVYTDIARDVFGKPTAITQRNAASSLSVTRRYVYDNYQQLCKSIEPETGSTVMAYDNAGNLSWSASGQALPSTSSCDSGTRTKVTGRDHAYWYDASNRLTNVLNGPGGPNVIGLGYDARGNLSNKNGQLYSFDHGNRLRSALGTQTYRYDALGRRVRTASPAGLLYEVYSQDGKLRWQRDEQAGERLHHIYLGGSLVATRRMPMGDATATVTYQHTDALGSPIASTNEAGTVIQTTEHEPYGQQLNRSNDNRPGYTGHVMDQATGLVQMQQRYYDPGLGRFLSIDPVGPKASGGVLFNRYYYARNNPYRYYDPDGRCTGSRITNIDNTCASTGEFTTQAKSAKSVGVNSVSSVFSHSSVSSPDAGVSPVSSAMPQTSVAARRFLRSSVGGAVGREAVRTHQKINLIQILPESGFLPSFSGGYDESQGGNYVSYSLNVSGYKQALGNPGELRGVGLDTLLAHEIGHTLLRAAALGHGHIQFDSSDMGEVNVVRHFENPYRRENGLPVRQSYGGTPIP